MCIARSRFASSINGRFSSSVNSFHSAPVKRQTEKQFVEWDMREWTTSSMCAYVGVNETNQRWNRSWNNGETKEARNCWRSCYIEVFHESRINFKASTRLSRFNHFPFVFQFQCLSMRHEHRRHTQKVNRNSGRKKNCFNWKKKENGGWQKGGTMSWGWQWGKKFFQFFPPHSGLSRGRGNTRGKFSIIEWQCCFLRSLFSSALLPRRHCQRRTENWKKVIKKIRGKPGLVGKRDRQLYCER